MSPRRRLGVVITTISDGAFLEHFTRAMREYRGPESLAIYVVGDLNTNPQCELACLRWRSEGYDVRYIDVAAQEEFLRRFAQLQAAIPYRSDNRRNVGFLLALGDSCDVVISADDDNLPSVQSDFFGNHAQTGRYLTLPEIGGAARWANVCELLTVQTGRGERLTVYPRGFPHSCRGADHTKIGERSIRAVCGANLGLWCGDPDVDAATRLVTGCSAERRSESACFLAAGQRTPISSQNCAVLAAAVPAYYYWRMGCDVGGMRLERYGDMFSGYCLQLCAEAVGHRLRIGPPYVRQARNPHNLLKDLWHELPGMVLLEDMRELIEQPLTRTNTYASAYQELAARLPGWAASRKGFLWEHQLTGYIQSITETMHAWLDACAQLMPRGSGGMSHPDLKTEPPPPPSVVDTPLVRMTSGSVSADGTYFENTLKRLNSASARKACNAYADIDWNCGEFQLKPSEAVWDLAHWQPDHVLSRTPWYQTLSCAERAAFGLHVAVQYLGVGVQFERLLCRGLLRYCTTVAVDPAERRYIYHEIGEEIQHSLMFAEFITRSPFREARLGIVARTLAEIVVSSVGLVPEVLFMGALAGEAPIDHVQRAILRDGRAHPLLERIIQLHTLEEARHIRYAEEYLRKRTPTLPLWRRALLAIVTPFILRLMHDWMVLPHRQTAKEHRVPMPVLRRAVSGKAAVRARTMNVATIRRLCVELKILSSCSYPLWKWLGLLPLVET